MTVVAMIVHSSAHVAPAPMSNRAVLISVKLNLGRVRPEMALEGMFFSSRGHPPQMRISTCLAGILAYGHRVMCLPSRVSPVALMTPLPHTVAGTAPDLPPDGYSALGSLLQPWPLASGIQTPLKNGKAPQVSMSNMAGGQDHPSRSGIRGIST